MDNFFFGMALTFTTWPRIYLQDHRAQLVCCRLSSVPPTSIPATPCTINTVRRPVALRHSFLATSQPSDQTAYLLDETKQTSKTNCQEIRYIIFHHIHHICCIDRWSLSCRYLFNFYYQTNFSGNKVPTNIAGTLLTNWGLIQPDNGNPNQTMPDNLNATLANSTS